jgi:hypothetical protein
LRPSFEAMGTPLYRQFLGHPSSSKLKQKSAPLVQERLCRSVSRRQR